MSAETQTIGDYRLLRLLGQGGMGFVYEAIHQKSDEIVALKTIRDFDELNLEGIRLEIRALAKINHPNIIHIIDQGVSDGMPWYAMELLSGQTLGHYFGFHDDNRYANEQTVSTNVITGECHPPDSSKSEDDVWWTITLDDVGEKQPPPPVCCP